MSEGVPDFADLLKSGIIVKGNDPSLDLIRLPIGIPQIDELNAGGFCFGKNYMFVGPESTGKTLIAQYVAAAVQRAGKQVLLVDAERGFDSHWWASTGVELSKLMVTAPPTGEESIDAIRSTMLGMGEDLGLVILDSMAALTPNYEAEHETGDLMIGATARLAAKMMRVIMPINKNPGAIFIIINQIRENIGGYEEQYPGGRSLRHNSHAILRMRREGWIKEGTAFMGFNIEVSNVKHKLGGRQKATVTVPFTFAKQIDAAAVFFDEGVAKEIITAGGGGYYTFGEHKWQGKAKAIAAFSDPELFRLLQLALEGKT